MFLKNNKNILLLIALAAAVRVIAALAGSLSIDEGAVIRIAHGLSWTEIFRMPAAGTWVEFTPSYAFIVVLKLWMLVSTSDLWIRMLSILPGVAAIPLIFAAAAKLTDRRSALWAAAIAALASQPVAFSRAVDFHGLLLFLIALSIYLWLINVLDEPRESLIVILGLVLSAALILHPVAVFLIIPMNIVFLWRHIRCRGLWMWIGVMTALIVVAVFCWPLWERVASYKPQAFIFQTTIDTRYIPQQILLSFKLFELYFRAFYALCFFRIASGGSGNVLIFPALILTPVLFHFIVLYGFRPKPGDEVARPSLFFLFTLLFIPGCALLSGSIDTQTAFLPAFIPFYLLIASAMSRIDARSTRIAVILMLAFPLLHFLYAFYATQSKSADWRAAAAFLDRNASSREPVLFIEARQSGPFLAYSRRAYKWTSGLSSQYTTSDPSIDQNPKEIIGGVFRGVFDPMQPDTIDQLFRLKHRFWIVYSELPPPEPDRVMRNREYIEKATNLLKRKKFRGNLVIELRSAYL